MDSIDKKLKQRIKKATGNFDQAIEVFETVLPILEKNLQSDPYAIRLFEEGLLYLKNKQAENETIVGKMKEVEPDLKKARHEWAHIDTISRGREYFLQGDVDTVKGLLEGFMTHPQVLTDALVLLEETKFKEIEVAMAEAKQRKLDMQ